VGEDYKLRPASKDLDAKQVAKMLKEAKASGKQLWYFTAPASLPISVVEKMEVAMDRAQQGLSIISHNGDDYGISFEDNITTRTIKILIPNSKDKKYGIRE
jgi:hypothetical protein